MMFTELDWLSCTLLLLALAGMCWCPKGVEAAFIVNKAKPLSPVILVPGDAGSRLEGKINKQNVPHFFCEKQTKSFFSLWLNIEFMTPLLIDCWIDNILLNYDNETRTTSNQPGVETRVPGWGDPTVVEYLDPSERFFGATHYFNSIADSLVQHGYERNLSLRGAPYDFRKGPNEQQQWFADMKQLIEDTSGLNEGAPITLLCHSMGCPLTLVFLHQQAQSWKDKYVSKFVSLAGAWGGSVKALKVFAVGDDFGAFSIKGSTLRKEQISMPSLAFLLPSPLFWEPDRLLALTKSRNYTINDLQDFFYDLDCPTCWEMRQDMVPYMKNFSPPGVETFCIFGTGLPTMETLLYPSDDLSGKPSLLTGEGDGTVNTRSLRACAQWKGKQTKNVHVVEIPGVDHFYQILSNATVIDRILEFILVQ